MYNVLSLKKWGIHFISAISGVQKKENDDCSYHDTYVSRQKIRDKKILQKGFVFMSGFLGCDNNEET